MALGTTVPLGYPLRMIVLPSGWHGTLTVKDGSSNTIVTIAGVEEPPSATNTAQQIIARSLMRLWPVPDAAYVLSLVWWMEPTRLSEDGDVPLIPVAPYLVHKAAAAAFLQMDKTADAAREESEAQAAIMAAIGQHRQDRLRVARPAMGSMVARGYRSWGW